MVDDVDCQKDLLDMPPEDWLNRRLVLEGCLILQLASRMNVYVVARM